VAGDRLLGNKGVMSKNEAFGLALLATLALALHLSAGQRPSRTSPPVSEPAAQGSSSAHPPRVQDGPGTKTVPPPAEEPRSATAPADRASTPAEARPRASGVSPSPPRRRTLPVVRRRELERDISELEAEVRSSHAALRLLSHTVFSARPAAAWADITFTNDLSGAYRLERARFALDGAVQYSRRDTSGKLAAQREIPIFSGSIPPGNHTLQVLLKLRGHGHGVFSYLRGYEFEVKSLHSFEVPRGRNVQLTVNAWETGEPATSLEQRPAVRFAETVSSGPGTVAPGGGSPTGALTPSQGRGGR
jgi:hypothetical protein